MWCRLIIPINVATFETTFETFKRSGLDLLCDHWSDFPPEYLRWIEEGCQLQVPQLMRDEGIRTEVQDAISDVLDGYELLVTPWPARQSSPPRTAAQKGPASVHGIDVDPLIGWFLTWPVDFSGHPVASIPAVPAARFSASLERSRLLAICSGERSHCRAPTSWAAGCQGWHAPGICLSRFHATTSAALVS